MNVVMKYRGVPRMYHLPKEGGGVVCGMKTPENFWGEFIIPDEMLRVLPGCSRWQREHNPPTNEQEEKPSLG